MKEVLMKKSIMILIFLVLLTGCKTTQYSLYKPDNTEQERTKDIYECRVEILKITWDQRQFDDLMNECMRARGHTVTEI